MTSLHQDFQESIVERLRPSPTPEKAIRLAAMPHCRAIFDRRAYLASLVHGLAQRYIGRL